MPQFEWYRECSFYARLKCLLETGVFLMKGRYDYEFSHYCQ